MLPRDAFPNDEDTVAVHIDTFNYELRSPSLNTTGWQVFTKLSYLFRR